jgi:hypothetical protein
MFPLLYIMWRLGTQNFSQRSKLFLLLPASICATVAEHSEMQLSLLSVTLFFICFLDRKAIGVSHLTTLTVYLNSPSFSIRTL